jgi:hypothetical protein
MYGQVAIAIDLSTRIYVCICIGLDVAMPVIYTSLVATDGYML